MWEEFCKESALAFPRVVIPFQNMPKGNEDTDPVHFLC